jgi:Tol biopolymer transport system component
MLSALAALLAVALLGSISSHAATTERVSVSSTDEQANRDCRSPSISADGRFVAFASEADNLVPNDTNGKEDVFIRDRLTGTTERVSVSSAGEQGNGVSAGPSISADGRFVAFSSIATNLVPGDANATTDVFVRDSLSGTTELVSISTAGGQGNYGSGDPSISRDGRFVAFTSEATNLVAHDGNEYRDVFVRDRAAGTTQCMSLSTLGRTGNSISEKSVITPDGRFVAFFSFATDLLPGGGGYGYDADVFVRDRATGTVAPVTANLRCGMGYCLPEAPCISSDARFVAFESDAWNLVPDDIRYRDVFVRDRAAGVTERISVYDFGVPDYFDTLDPSLSADGRFVAVVAAREICEEAGERVICWYQTGDVYVFDRMTGLADRVSESSAGEPGNGASSNPSVSADGRFIAFESGASNLVPGDTNYRSDIFVRDRSPVAPPDLRIVINDGARYACSPDATLGLQFPDGSVEMRLRNDPGDWSAWEPCAPQKAWTLSAGDGLKTVCMQCRDAQGNLSAEVCDLILLDTTPPTDLSIRIADGADCLDQAWAWPLLNFGARDASQMRFSNDGQTWSAWQTYGGEKSWTLSEGRGLKTVWFQCRDACGRESGVVSDSIWWALFDDVSCEQSERKYIEALFRKAITSGCSMDPPMYCPYSNITRAQMAVFLCKATGKGPLNRDAATFCDVPKTSPYYGWIERLADTDSWGGNPPTIGCLWFPCRKFCPSTAVLRDEMAAFLVRATGKTPMPSCSQVFADVSPSSWACPYIERLTDAASWPGGNPVTAGCACPSTSLPSTALRAGGASPSGYPPGAKCYCPKSNVTRGQMAVFIVKAFGIPM